MLSCCQIQQISWVLAQGKWAVGEKAMHWLIITILPTCFHTLMNLNEQAICVLSPMKLLPLPPQSLNKKAALTVNWTFALQAHVIWRMLEHMIVVRWGSGSEMFSCVRVRSAVCFPSFADSPYNVISFTLFLPPPLSLYMCRENEEHKLPMWMNREGKAKGTARIPCGLSFPLTFASWTLHQQ